MDIPYIAYDGRVVTRAEASAQGLKRYFTGKPCKSGHIAQRYTRDGACYFCALAKCRGWQSSNRDKSCASARKWQLKNPDRVAATARAYLDRNAEGLREKRRVVYAEFRDQRRLYASIYYKAHTVECRKRALSYRIRFPDQVKRAVKAWADANPEAVTANRAKRRARKSGSLRHFTADDVKSLFSRQKGKCAGCLRSIRNGYHVDHIHPLSRGGGNGPDNIQLLCQTCNQSKHAKHPIDWARENGRLL